MVSLIKAQILNNISSVRHFKSLENTLGKIAIYHADQQPYVLIVKQIKGQAETCDVLPRNRRVSLLPFEAQCEAELDALYCQ